MLSRIMLSAGLLGLLSSAALAQAAAPPTLYGHAPDAFKHLSGAEQAALVNKPDPLVSSVVSDHENWYSQIIARNATGVVEVHDHWIDVMSVMSGDATITYGGTVAGGQPTTPGEWRGGTITGGTSVEVHPGDYIQIPAGVPHLTALAPGAHFRVLVVKIRQ